MSYYVYLGPLGEIVRHDASFTASKDGFLIGTYVTFGEAMESLAWKGRAKAGELTGPISADVAIGLIGQIGISEIADHQLINDRFHNPRLLRSVAEHDDFRRGDTAYGHERSAIPE